MIYKKKYPCLKDRSRKGLKTWVFNQNKSKSKPKTSKIKVIKNKSVQYNLTKLVEQDFDPPLLD